MGVLHSLALALAQGGEHAMAEDKLLEAIRQLQELDGVNADSEDCVHKVTVVFGDKLRFVRRCTTGGLFAASGSLSRRVHLSTATIFLLSSLLRQIVCDRGVGVYLFSFFQVAHL